MRAQSKNIKYAQLTQHNFEDYVFEDETIKDQLLTIAKEKMEKQDTILIMSTEGNGGTFLMRSFLNLLTDKEKEVLLIGGDNYYKITNSNVEDYVAFCMQYKFIAFDNIEVACAVQDQYNWLKLVFELLKKNGVKTLATYTKMDYPDLKVPRFIQENRHEIFYSLNRPTKYVELIKIFFKEIGENYSDKIMLEITSNPASNIRVLTNSCYTYHARKLLKYNGCK
jgi:chromosomal replication initiation ATPase DnaA